MSYHVDRFYAAVSVLAGHGHIKQRLIRAYEDNLVDVTAEELPVAVKQTFSDLKNQMNRVSPLNGEGPICASVRKMSVDEASDCAKVVVEVYREIAAIAARPSTTLTLKGKDRDRVPPFLVKSH